MKYNKLDNDLIWVVPSEDLICLKDFEFDFFRVIDNKKNNYLSGMQNIFNVIDLETPSSNLLLDYCMKLSKEGYITILISNGTKKLIELFLPENLTDKQIKFFSDMKSYLMDDTNCDIVKVTYYDENNYTYENSNNNLTSVYKDVKKRIKKINN